jgi:hypothetical protein
MKLTKVRSVLTFENDYIAGISEPLLGMVGLRI